ncbi:MAG: TlpA family protein disulfide reductase [Saprospiraceae bacterium]|nr:TlpA family protein disulfide reductase [Saprospiraceae bacterium]MCB0623599.1 TlpA family protein disulfide reductase [Saprospiraceae bacterium]MCB0677653.1 TlpA family protein disulfide reductase [Saprospiraceae bacterium]MCB0682098.1 TlpA family protein disulfide reductase [Saprospiraceae bacterium]
MKKMAISTFVPLLAVGLYLAGRHLYFKPKFINGAVAPAISATTANGASFELDDLRGHFVLVDFWGSWCGPCRMENRNLVRLYEKYGQASFSEGGRFDIVSIGVEEKESAWRQAMVKDGLTWPYQIVDLTGSLRFFDSPIARSYGVKALPTSFLLNQKGEIIGVNLTFEELDRLLSRHQLSLN